MQKIITWYRNIIFLLGILKLLNLKLEFVRYHNKQNVLI